MDQELFGIVDDPSASNHPSHTATTDNQDGLLVNGGDGSGGVSGRGDGDGDGANGSTGDDQAPAVRSALVFPTAQLLTMISNDADADLGTRAFRLIAGRGRCITRCIIHRGEMYHT